MSRRTVAIVLAVLFVVLWASASRPTDDGTQVAPDLVGPLFGAAVACVVWAVVEHRRRRRPPGQ